MVTNIRCDASCSSNVNGICKKKELRLKQNVRNCDYGDYPEHLHCEDYEEDLSVEYNGLRY